MAEGPPPSRVLRPAAWPIAAKLSLVLLGASLLPMGVTAALDLWQAREAAERAEHDNLEMLARSSAGRVDQLLGDTRRVIAQIARDAEVAAYLQAPPEARAPLAATEHRTFENVASEDISLAFLLDARGVCVISTSPEEVGLDYTGREYFRGAVRGGDFISELRTGITTKRPGVYFSRAVEGADGRVVGIAVIKLAGEALGRLVEAVHPPGGGSFLVDGWGVIISHSDRALLYKSLAPLPESVIALPVFDRRFASVGVDSIESVGLDALAARLGKGGDGSTDIALARRGRMLAGFAHVRSKGWSLVVFEPEERLHAPLALVTQHTAYNALFVGGVVTLLALLLARTIVRPLRRLTDAARAVRRGDYRGAHVEEGSEDELGALSGAFNTMAHGLAERERVLEIFGRVVSPEVREKLLAGRLALGGEMVRAAVLFSDIRGFSTMAEKMDPHAVVALINEYLTEMTEATAEYHGYINNFIGDAIVVIFGAPIAQRDAERRAVLAALAMRRALAALNRRRAARGDAPIETGIGIAVGDMVAGQIGSPARMLYTVIGDAVNVAARLEALTKEYPGKPILITRRVADALAADPTSPRADPLGPIKLKGRSEPVEVFALDCADAPEALSGGAEAAPPTRRSLASISPVSPASPASPIPPITHRE